MSDQQNDWWTNPDAAPQQPAAPPAPVAPAADATVVIPPHQAGAPQPNPTHGAPPPDSGHGAAPPNYGHQQPSHGHQQPPAYGTPQFVQPADSTSTYRSPGGAITMIVGALLAVLGTVLPWVTFPGGSVNGYERYFIGDGRDRIEWANPGAFVAVTMVLVVIVAVIVLTAGRNLATWLIGLLVTGLAGLTTLAALGAVGSVLDESGSGGGLDVGLGAGLCLLGAIIAGVGAILVAAKRS